MSRIGKLPVEIPNGVQVSYADAVVTVKGPKGSLTQKLTDDISLSIDGNVLTVTRPTEQKRHKALHGLYRALIQNMITGVSTGFKTEQELVGVGYRATNQGQMLDLVLGYSHHVVFELPAEIKVATRQDKGQNPIITLESHDKQLIGQITAKIRSLRVPEPYKGKGIKYVGETLRRKAGKSAAKK